MPKETTRSAIIREGARLIHKKGYHATGLSDILTAAGIPKGSFYFYFRNKEEFGLAVIDHYAEAIAAMGSTYLGDISRPPLHRLAAFMDGFTAVFAKMNFTCGCPIGNLMQEMSDLNEAFRDRVGSVYARMAEAIAQCLDEAKDKGDVPEYLDAGQTAQFILNSWEGAIMHMKLVKDRAPLKLCRRMLFEYILKK